MLLTNAPSPYQVELLTAIDRRPGLRLEVRFMRDCSSAAPDAARGWSFSHRVLAGVGGSRRRDELRLHPRALWEAAFGRADCYVLSGLYTSLTFLGCAMLLTLRRKPWALWLERPRADGFRMRWMPVARLRRMGLVMRRWVLRCLLGSSSGTIAIGSAAVQAYTAVAPERARMMMLPYCCDVSRFARVDPAEVETVRNAHGLDGRFVFLFSGQMIQRKGVDTLLRAFEQVAHSRPNVALLLLGDGPERATYEAAVPPELADRVRFAGFRQQAELPAYFNAADVFVFASRHDGWGVVLNEACGAGLPIIASRETGAAHDLVADGESGRLFDAADVDALARCMAEYADAPQRAAAAGRASRRRVQRFSVARGAEQFQQHIQALIERPTRMERPCN